jgi:Type II secretion system (T2SS), protein M subtype b
MTVGTLDRRTVRMLLASVAAMLLLRFVLLRDKPPQVVSASDSAPLAEKRLERVREMAATVKGKQALLDQAMAELKTRESGIIKADTAAQAQAQLMDLVHRVAAANGFDARGAEQLTEARPLGADYGQVSVTQTFTCGIDQLVNFLAELANEPSIVYIDDLHISGGSDKKKNVTVRLSLSGVVPRKLVPVKKGGPSF